MKEFNYTGTCILEKHYMVDISEKLNRIKKDVDSGEYLAIELPKYFGKTTTLSLLENKLQDDYIVLKLNFNQFSIDKAFENTENFVREFLKKINEILKKHDKSLLELDSNFPRLYQLDEAITELILRVEQEVVLLIDDVDKYDNTILFQDFLGILRSKFLAAQRREEKSFHSVILVGVNDIKNIKLENHYTIPWNIASDFNMDMSFNITEIKTMLEKYEADKNTGMDTELISAKLHDYTSGHPYLVSKLCYILDETVKINFTEEGLDKAADILLSENDSLLDYLTKSIDNHEENHNLIRRLILNEERISFSYYAYQLAMTHGIVKKDRKTNTLIIHNKLYEKFFYNYLLLNKDREEV